MNEIQKAEREGLEEAARNIHTYLTDQWIRQGKPEVIQTDGGPLNFKQAHDKNWKDLQDFIQAHGLETDREKQIREEQEALQSKSGG